MSTLEIDFGGTLRVMSGADRAESKHRSELWRRG